MIDFDSELNKEQLDVVRHGDGACLVLAGAGSGKTRTIIYRVAYLLEQGVNPEEILLVTFTNKAAKEMVQRLERIVEGQMKLPWSGTFHRVTYKILRKYASLLGYSNNFTILDSGDSLDLLKLCIKQEGVDRKKRRFPSAKVLRSLISYARNAQMPIEDVLKEKHPQWMDIADVISRIGDDYAKRKKEAQAMDFDDLLVNAYLLFLKNEKLRRLFSTQFKYVLVDEYQDTNRIQASLIHLLSSHHKNLLVVGDDAQSIYSFRAADIKNILDFEARFRGAKVFRLETNYRSTPEILFVANDVISHNASQYQKTLRATRDVFCRPEVHPFSDIQEEAAFIADRVLELRDEGVALPKIAVLFRAAYQSQALEVELVKRDIPYEYRGGVRFFDRSHIKDVLGYLRVFHNPVDVVAWSRVLTMQAGIGPASAQKIIQALKGSDDDVDLEALGQSILSVRARVGWADFLSVWEGLHACENPHPHELIKSVLDSNYVTYIENEHDNYRERLQDIEQLALYAERQPDIAQFLADVTLQEGFTAAQARGVSDDDEHMVLSTIHQAKGLEWDTVFVMGVSNGQFPSERSLKEPKGLEEERRLFYVAVTRAERLLYFSYSLTGGFRSALAGPSVFIDEIARDLVDHHNFRDLPLIAFTDPSDSVDNVSYVAEDDAWNDWGEKRTSFLKSIDEY
ncbi:MAG: ATP-dependent helicase [Candidatus Magasanikbacteria bacterium]|jgi:DNA helicase II / ATP-dependent DNA helicase PcrA|nr:ATP-dependent helicase [Candidatus Magasanikbacteria bacterium]MBT4220751.1 ATP-dependent helicase [Candidatus Magasanikbacteria bacterium]MBT4350096.1 ATP-dependent helicase [Candidatus Magasanikbacteria bacterium]MBT4541461.1 ATP-dependent helicase [Candidatus Magasanikbacteria bacterium]MBT6252989.1 ATP-dependent helicase [Candidatus Magasanikbacteria bacterium]